VQSSARRSTPGVSCKVLLAANQDISDTLKIKGVSMATPSFFAPCFADERNRYDAGLSCPTISTETRIGA
jgi:hypothetical protein